MRTLEIPLINCEANFMLTYPANCVICEVDRATPFAITDTKLYAPIAILSM